jgi:UDP-2,4-diacetamido-2,4,6-trideoxy-beta-L-altropyranose hydrolase
MLNDAAMVMSAPGLAVKPSKVCRILDHEDSRAPVPNKPVTGRTGREGTGRPVAMAIGTLMIRADAGGTVGAGHLMRCLALAEAWIERGGRAVMAVPAGLPDGLTARIQAIGAVFHGMAETPDAVEASLRLAVAENADWIAVDGYRFGSDWLAALAGTGRPVLAIDDDSRHDGYPVRLILNQNLHARTEDYAGKSDADLLLGPKNALIRSEFRTAPGWRRAIPERAENILVTLGGADPGGHTARVLEALRLLGESGAESPPSVRVIAGAANPRLDGLRGLAAELDGVEILSDVRDMGAQMRWCDLAVSASGSTVWEMALFATPMLLGTASPVEEPVARSLDAAGAALHLGRLAELRVEELAEAITGAMVDHSLRSRLSNAAAGLVDGEGARRVVRHMLALCDGVA